MGRRGNREAVSNGFHFLSLLCSLYESENPWMELLKVFYEKPQNLQSSNFVPMAETFRLQLRFGVVKLFEVQFQNNPSGQTNSCLERNQRENKVILGSSHILLYSNLT